MTVYLDVLFLLNVSMDYLILYAVSGILHTGKRLWLCALLGGIYGILAAEFSWCGNIGLQLLFSCVMILLAYRPVNFFQFLRFFLVFQSVSFVLGGILYKMILVSKQGRWINGVVYFDFSLLQFSVFTLLCWLFLTLGAMICHRVARTELKTIKISGCGKEVCLSALSDTGCTLTEPITGWPVVAAEYEKIAEILSPGLREAVISGKTEEISERIYWVPFQTVGESDGLMIAFCPERISVLQGKNECVLQHVLIGIVRRKLTEDQSYSALLNPAMTI